MNREFAALIGFGVFFWGLCVYAYKTGKIHGDGGVISRVENPFMFWVCWVALFVFGWICFGAGLIAKFGRRIS